MLVVIISDKPSAPEGPLSVSNLTATSADLEWKPPTTDGGSPITGYVIESKTSSRGSWTKVANVDGSTTKYSPKDLREGADYLFRVSAINEEGTGSPLETTEPVKPQKKIGKKMTYFCMFFKALNLVKNVCFLVR